MGRIGIDTVVMWLALAFLTYSVSQHTAGDGREKFGMWAMLTSMAVMSWLMGGSGMLGAIAMWVMIAGMTLTVKPACEAVTAMINRRGGAHLDKAKMPDRKDIVDGTRAVRNMVDEATVRHGRLGFLDNKLRAIAWKRINPSVAALAAAVLVLVIVALHSG